ncbi:calponin homology domain-containing protein DDB_G0272472 [Solanum tuberosum]|nr:PREDICTED: calponin homology domain-containing protein DDB_G0272472 [Solanum tuberosum]
MSSTITRKPKWHPTPPPPPSPKILHFPRRTRRKTTRNTKKKQLYPMEKKCDYYKGRLESLFDQERHFHGSSSSINPIVLLNTSTSSSSSYSAQRRERVEEQEQEGAVNGGGDAGDREEEKWRFQAEMLRAECNFLRMERQFALKKLERNRLQMEKTLRSAVHTLIAGKKKIFEGKNVNAVLEEEIEDLAEKLEELKKSCKNKDVEVRHCSNFDKKACHLQKRLEKLGGLTDEKALKELQQLAESTNEIDKETKNNTSTDVELLREKMEGLSKGMLDRMEEEYGAILSSTANSSVASSASTSKRIDSITDPTSSFSTRQQPSQDMMPLEENKCSGRCKVIVRRIVEQVRAETEQWSQMQEMLQQVRGEMEELQASRDFWENRALDFAHEIQSLQSSVEEWKDKAQAFETKAKDMQYELTAAKDELEKSRTKKSTAHDQREVTSTPNSPLLSLAKQIEKEKRILVCRLKEENANQKLQKQRGVEVISTKDLPPVSLGKQLEKEKRMFMHRLKENRGANDMSCKREVSPVERRKEHYSCSKESRVPKRPPFRDVGNSSSLLVRQNSKAIYPLHSP